MTAQPRSSPRTARAPRKGEITRNHILEAALEVIATQGLAGTSHRLIARQANVNLSMTTYHFRSLDDLIESAFDLYLNRSQPFRELLADKARAIFATHAAKANQADALADRNEALGTLITEHIRSGIEARHTDLAVECAFIFAWHPSDSLRAKVVQLNESVLAAAAELLAAAGSPAPRLDAELLTAAIRQIEFQFVTSGEPLDVTHLRSLVGRLVHSVLR